MILRDIEKKKRKHRIHLSQHCRSYVMKCSGNGAESLIWFGCFFWAKVIQSHFYFLLSDKGRVVNERNERNRNAHTAAHKQMCSCSCSSCAFAVHSLLLLLLLFQWKCVHLIPLELRYGIWCTL